MDAKTKDQIIGLARCTATPLASIFGSGFLVIVSVLAGVVGPYSIFAMAGICLLAYAVGGVIRFNIAHVEAKVDQGTASEITKLLDRISDIALVPAYVISVTLYLRILASYALGFFGIDTEYNERCVTTAIIAFILFIGISKGLKILSGLERWALHTTMAIVVVLIGAFVIFDIGTLYGAQIVMPPMPHTSAWHVVTVLAGTLIVVQGFETTRYLGDEFDAATRIKACRHSQLVSTVVYLLLIASATPLMHTLAGTVSDNGLIKLAGLVAAWLPAPLVLAAVFSQFSAATADTIGASGNLMETSKNRVPEKLTYALICGFAILLTWLANTMDILALASRAFAFYYFVQCLVAFSVAETPHKRMIFICLSAAMLFIVIFAVPVS